MYAERYYYGSYADVAAIRLPTSQRSNWLLKTPAEPGIAEVKTRMTSSIGQFDDHQGDAICMAGRSSDYACGKVTDISYTTTYADGTKFYYQRVASFIARPGDSGGPVFAGQKIVGVISGRKNAGTPSISDDYLIYSNMGFALQELKGVESNFQFWLSAN